jgi:hypothetical protein
LTLKKWKSLPALKAEQLLTGSSSRSVVIEVTEVDVENKEAFEAVAADDLGKLSFVENVGSPSSVQV